MKKEVIIDLICSSLAILSLLLMFDHEHQYRWLTYVILFIFFVVICIDFCKTDNKWQYIKTHPLELIALIPAESVFQGAMLVRLVRLLLLGKVLKKHFPRFTGILLSNGLYKVLLFTLATIILAAIPITFFEESIGSIAEGIWWGIVTTTTVGYGDIAPVTWAGRLIAVILMFFGIGCIGMITGSVASYLSKTVEKDEDKQFIKSKIDCLESLSEEEFEMLLSMLVCKRKTYAHKDTDK
ncbi:MAG: potassium channel family protein [Bacillus sp. (in: firmicutes)]